MHDQTISWNDNWILIFICFVGRLLEPSASSFSSFIIISFLIQMLRWIRDSSRVEIFWMVRAWCLVASIFSSFIMSRSSSHVHSSQSVLKVITSFWHTFLKWMNTMILGCHSRWLSPLLHSPLLLLPLQVVLHSGSSLLQLFSQSHLLI